MCRDCGHVISSQRDILFHTLQYELLLKISELPLQDFQKAHHYSSINCQSQLGFCYYGTGDHWKVYDYWLNLPEAKADRMDAGYDM